MASVRHLGFWNLQFLSRGLCRYDILLPHTKCHWNRTIGWWVIAKKRFSIWRPSAILNFMVFGQWMSSGSKSAVVYQISSKSDDVYRATSMHSADYAIGRCLSVRLSVLEMGMHEKIAPKRNIFGIWRRPLEATAPCHTFLETSF